MKSTRLLTIFTLAVALCFAFTPRAGTQFNSEAIMTDIPPAAPTDLRAVASSASTIDLSWTDNSNNEKGFKVIRTAGVVPAGTGTLAYLPANYQNFTDSNLSASATYSYKVEAYNDAGASDYSNEASAMPSANVPKAPTNLIATYVSSGTVTLTWNDKSNNETAFKVRRGPDEQHLAQIASLGPNVIVYHDNSLRPATTYVYRVRAENASGSAGSNFLNVRTLQ